MIRQMNILIDLPGGPAKPGLPSRPGNPAEPGRPGKPSSPRSPGCPRPPTAPRPKNHRNAINKTFLTMRESIYHRDPVGQVDQHHQVIL